MKKYYAIKHMKYEIESDSGRRVFVIPYESEIPDLKNVLCLSDTSLFIWELINKGFSAENIVEEVSEKYNHTKETVQNDIDEFLGNLQEKGFIKCFYDN